MGFEDILFWHWWVAALAFLVFEMVVTAYFFLWLAFAAAVVGLVVMAAPDMSWQLQFSIWALLSIVSLVGWKLYRRANPKEEEDDGLSLNQRGNQYIGRTFTLEKATENGKGKIEVDDSIWKIETDTDFKKGDKVKVISVDGTVLKVEAA